MRNGFSLIELLVVIAILGIISAVGLTVYNDFLTEAKREATFASDVRVNRSIDQDYISLSNDLSGTTDIVGETNINSSSNCYDYLKASVTGIEVGDNVDSMDGSLTIGSTLVQTLSDKITVNLSSADQSTFSTALNGNCYVKTNSAFNGVSSSVLRDSQ